MVRCMRWCNTALLLGTVVLTGCATYSDSFGVIERDLSIQRYDDALAEIEKQSQSNKDKVLYLLNKGMILRMKRDYGASNQTFEAAKTEMERLYAASVSENALSFVVNDSTVSYAGDDYEQVLVHLYMALNYLQLGQSDDARVEALQVDLKLREIAEKIPESSYTEDALSRYLAGMIYEERREWSDAMISYRKAYEAYKKYQKNYGLPMPDMLKHDLLRLAKRVGLTDELRQYQQEFGIDPSANDDPAADTDGELVFVLNNGLAPIKKEKIINATAPVAVSVGTSDSGKPAPPPVVVTIAVPYYVSRPDMVVSARVTVSGKQVKTENMENIDAIARASLDARMPAIMARSIARAVAKAEIQKSVDRAGSNRDNDAAAALLGSFIVRVAAIATERADTRSWLTLPANVQIAKLALPPGDYTVKVDLMNTGGSVVSTLEYPDVAITPQHYTYLSQHWISN